MHRQNQPPGVPCAGGLPAHGSGQPGRTPPLGEGFAAVRPLRRLPKPPTSHPGARVIVCPATQASRTSPPRSGRRRRRPGPLGDIAPAHLQRTLGGTHPKCHICNDPITPQSCQFKAKKRISNLPLFVKTLLAWQGRSHPCTIMHPPLRYPINRTFRFSE